MAYNPVWDLVVGLFLIFVPVFVLAWLGFAWTVLHKQDREGAGKPSDPVAAIESLDQSLESYLSRNGEVAPDQRAAVESLLLAARDVRQALEGDAGEEPVHPERVEESPEAPS